MKWQNQNLQWSNAQEQHSVAELPDFRQVGFAGTPESPVDAAHYPTLQRTADTAILSCDWLARYLPGKEKVFAFHTINLRTHTPAQTIRADKSIASACAHMLAAFSTSDLHYLVERSKGFERNAFGEKDHFSLLRQVQRKAPKFLAGDES